MNDSTEQSTDQLQVTCNTIPLRQLIDELTKTEKRFEIKFRRICFLTVSLSIKKSCAMLINADDRNISQDLLYLFEKRNSRTVFSIANCS